LLPGSLPIVLILNRFDILSEFFKSRIIPAKKKSMAGGTGRRTTRCRTATPLLQLSSHDGHREARHRSRWSTRYGRG